MNIDDVAGIEQIARHELDEEEFRRRVEIAKDRLRRGPWWRRWFPFTINITVTRRENVQRQGS